MVLLKLWGYSGSRKLRSRYRASFGEYPWSNKANAWHLRLPGSRLYLRATTTSCLSLAGFMETFYEMLMEIATRTIMETLLETEKTTCSDCVSLDRTPCCSPAAVLNLPSDCSAVEHSLLTQYTHRTERRHHERVQHQWSN